MHTKAWLLSAIALALCAVGMGEGGADMYFDMVDSDQNGKIDAKEIRGFMDTFGAMMVSERFRCASHPRHLPR